MRTRDRALTPRPARRAAAISVIAILAAGVGLQERASDAIGTTSQAGVAEPGRCGGEVVDIVGTEEADHLRGDGARNGVVGLAGQDRLVGAENRDGLCGGQGADVLSGGRGRDKLVGGPGDDVLRGGLAADTLIGGPGDDKCVGGAGPGHDRLRRC